MQLTTGNICEKKVKHKSRKHTFYRIYVSLCLAFFFAVCVLVMEIKNTSKEKQKYKRIIHLCFLFHDVYYAYVQICPYDRT